MQFRVSDMYGLSTAHPPFGMRGQVLGNDVPRPGMEMRAGHLRAPLTDVEATPLPEEGGAGYFLTIMCSDRAEQHAWQAAVTAAGYTIEIAAPAV